ncbi:type II toxin-antitoxin system HigB family toxin [uncultured Thiothrix sp.]|jgi:mRNA interferase HigB|uniref:type II toxin-antitoxin system HigB family toxin n=1 Tax=uncultured Thiothrix sp. TaxID=223185 RepID=UPI0026091722|nr:type II toxin-antitoxin system HigB family toxin [uncultured Thiothrix sp.]HMT94805.1 type II toxin-antitoxin system HigB family toxin [Thiolinea sp.]
MHIINRKRIIQAAELHKDCATALSGWYQTMKAASFTNFSELKASFNSVDKVEHLYVFDIGGNKLRLVAVIHFNTGKVFIHEILTHSEYDKGKWKE